MMSLQRPVRMIRLRSLRRNKFRSRLCFFGVTRPPSVLFLRRDTLPDPPAANYPIDLSRRSSTCWVVAESDLWGRSSKSEAPSLKNEDGNPPFKKSSFGQIRRKKIQLRANPPEADRNWLNTQLQLKKSILTTKSTYVDWLGIGAVYLTPQYVGLRLKPIHNSQFSLAAHRKSNVLSLSLTG